MNFFPYIDSNSCIRDHFLDKVEYTLFSPWTVSIPFKGKYETISY